MTGRYEIGQKFKAKMDIYEDLREEGFGVYRLARRGETLVIRGVGMLPGRYLVSHEDVHNSSFSVRANELEEIKSGT